MVVAGGLTYADYVGMLSNGCPTLYSVWWVGCGCPFRIALWVNRLLLCVSRWFSGIELVYDDRVGQQFYQ